MSDTAISPTASTPSRRDGAFVLKWAASIIQILGYASTAFGLEPWNLMFFFVGLIGWFIVGVLWRDRAIMLIHVVALGAMIVGILSR
ncbi:MAG: ubiquinone biosynthesis methyltransferase UbiE [Rhodobacteraceae bacterium]|nr:ubiquinone biosynthesis methyltransferase UbiE [Paracoccaceae bacterium]